MDVNSTSAVAVVQFRGSSGNGTPGPVDSVTGQPIIPVVTSDNTDEVSVGDGTPAADGTPGRIEYALTGGANPGVANLSVEALTNSDGSPVEITAPDGTTSAFPLPAAVAVPVVPEAAVSADLTVEG